MTTLVNEIKKIVIACKMTEKEAEVLIRKALVTSELENIEMFDSWFENRLKPHLVILNENDYNKMCLSALRALPTLSASDYGTSRQRDFMQMWADTTRGYLGELAVMKFLEKDNSIKLSLDHSRGELKKYVATDIHSISAEGEISTKTYNISIKTTKMNGVWLDVPSGQFLKSDVHVLVKIGLQRDHLFAFFKSIGFFEKIILPKGIEIEAFTKVESRKILKEIPVLKPIVAYICGIVFANDYKDKEPDFKGKKGRKHYNVSSWAGKLSKSEIEKLKKKYKIKGEVKFEGVGQFSHDGYIFSIDRLKFSEEAWKRLFTNL